MVIDHEGGMYFAFCPSPNFGRLPNHDVFHFSVSWQSFCSCGDSFNKVAMARINCNDCKENEEMIAQQIYNQSC